MNGFLIIDKPAGVTSFDVVRQVRRWSKVRRVGHAGTLDPLATGVLPVAIGKATRLIEYLMAEDKSYQATMQLGVTTDTQDAEGQVVDEKDWRGVTKEGLNRVISGFVGKNEQLPPMYSALKKDGQPLYKLARQGVEVERKQRTITIASLRIDEIRLPRVTFTVKCSKGTYVRTICHDIGQRLGCGAHMTVLRRLSCGSFEINAAHSLEELQSLVEQGRPLPVIPLSAVLADWPALEIKGSALQKLIDGVAPVFDELEGDRVNPGDRVKLVADGELLALANYVPGGVRKRPGDFELLKVFPPEKEC